MNLECGHSLGQHIVEFEVIGRIALLGILSGIGILAGYWTIDRISKRQAKENIEHIEHLKEAIKVLRDA